MKKEDCFHFGHISKSHGFQGELIFLTRGENQVTLNLLESVFIDINGQLIPFFIDSCNQTGPSTYLLKLNDISTQEKARQLVHCSVYIPLTDIPKQKEDLQQPFELNGYKVIDGVRGDIGEVINILVMPQQLILEILFGSKKILIPVHEDIIHKIDKKNKVVHIHAPDGLIDIYI